MAISLVLADNRRYFWQWDTKQYLIANELPVGAEIHYDMPGIDIPCKTTVELVDDMYIARVPDELLQHAGSFDVWAYVMEDDISGHRTVYSRSYDVEPREKPPGYVYTESDILSYETLDDRLSSVEEKLEKQTDIDQAVEDYLTANPPEITPVKIDGTTLTMSEEGVISVNTTDEAVQDNTQPITSSGVYMCIGNINSLLETI